MSKVDSFRLRFALVTFGNCLLLVSCLSAQEAEQPAADEAAKAPDADPFAVPENATAEDLLAFIETVQQPKEPPKTREEAIAFLQKASEAVSTAVDQLLSGEATVAQKVQATRIKIQALSRAAQFGNSQADAELEAFLERLLQSDTTELVQTAKQVRWAQHLAKWNQLKPQDRQVLLNEVVDDVKRMERPTAGQARFLCMLADRVADTPERKQAANAVEELIPVFQTSNDPGVAERLASMEGLVRRLRLPGNKMELSGTLLNGEPLNWDAYRGKVVLVDYWGTRCGPCRAEVPNMLENYQAYHNKGFEVLGISLDTDRADVEEYLKQLGIPWPTLFSTEEGANGWNHPMAKFYGINAIPAAILVDADGKVVDMNARGPRLGAKLQELLGDPLPPAQAKEDSATADPAAQTGTGVPIESR